MGDEGSKLDGEAVAICCCRRVFGQTEVVASDDIRLTDAVDSARLGTQRFRRVLEEFILSPTHSGLNTKV